MQYAHEHMYLFVYTNMIKKKCLFVCRWKFQDLPKRFENKRRKNIVIDSALTKATFYVDITTLERIHEKMFKHCDSYDTLVDRNLKFCHGDYCTDVDARSEFILKNRNLKA